MRARYWQLLSIALTLLLSSEAFSQQDISWQTDLQAARQQAIASNRLILVHFWAPWCAACRKMEQDVFVESNVVSAVQANYIPVKLNVEHNPGDARQLGVTALPTDVVIAPDGRVLDSYVGYITAPDYTGRLQRLGSVPRQPAAAAPLQQQPAAVADAAAMRQAPTVPQFVGNVPAGTSGNAAPPSWTPPAATAPVGPALAGPTFGPGTQAAGAAPRTPVANVPPQTAGVMPPQFASPGAVPNGTPPVTAAIPPQANQNALANAPTSSTTPQASVPMAAGFAPASPGMAGPELSGQAAGQAGAPPVELPLALDGYCPVELVENKTWKIGDRRWGATHEGRTYLFTGPEQQQKFLSAPDRYSPVNSGNDVVLALDAGQSVSGCREHGVFYGNRIYLFSSEDSLQAFSRQPGQYESALERASQASRAGNVRY